MRISCEGVIKVEYIIATLQTSWL